MANPVGPPTALDALDVMGVPTLGMAGAIPPSSKTYFVSSVTGSNGNSGTSLQDPFSTLAYAMTNKATARSSSNPAGTVFVVMPGHAESLAASGDIACSVAGVSVVGLGTGTNRPLFTMGTANTVAITVSAAGVSWDNCQFKGNFLSIAACFLLTTAASFKLTNCFFYDASASLNFLNIVKSTGAANTIDGLTCINNQWNGLGTTSVNSFILSADAAANVTLISNNIKLARTATAAALLTVTTGVLVNLDCGWNRTQTAATATTGGGTISVGGTTSSGFVYNNYQQTLGTATDILYTTTVGLAAFNNYVSGVIGASGFLIPTADS